MPERTTVAEVLRFHLQKADVPHVEAAKWIGVAPSTFAMKMKGSTFSAEEAVTILDNIGIEVALIEDKKPVNKKFGGVGPRVKMMVNKTIYDTSASIALCHTKWVDGWMRELFQDQHGRFFVAHYTKWEGATNLISEVGLKDAAMMYAKYGDGTMSGLFEK